MKMDGTSTYLVAFHWGIEIKEISKLASNLFQTRFGAAVRYAVIATAFEVDLIRSQRGAHMWSQCVQAFARSAPTFLQLVPAAS